MYSLSLPRVGHTSNLVPKHCINNFFVKFETLAKNQNVDNWDIHTKTEKSAIPPRRFDLPMGTKRLSFMSRRSPVKQQKVIQASAFSQLNNPGPFMLEKDDQRKKKVKSTPNQEPKEYIPTFLDSTLTKCTSQDNSSPPKQNKRGPNMEMVAYQLTQDLTNIFMQRQDWSIYHKEMVLQDNIRGVKMVGLERYIVLVNILRMLAHIRFVYVRMSILSLTKDKEEGVIKVRWRVVGLGMGRMVVRYFPDKLWEKGSMERMSPSYLDGFSTFYVDSNSKIYQHTVDKVMEDKEKDKVAGKTILQKLLELRQRSETQPAL